MKTLALVICNLLLLSSLARISTAESPSPVEVQIIEGDKMQMYSCWPMTEGNNKLVVYINYPDGIAGYACEYDGVGLLTTYRQPGNLFAKRAK